MAKFVDLEAVPRQSGAPIVYALDEAGNVWKRLDSEGQKWEMVPGRPEEAAPARVA